MGDYVLLFPVFFPILCAPFMPLLKKQRIREVIVLLILFVEAAAIFYLAFGVDRKVEVWRISGLLSITFANDGLSRIFSCFISAIWFLAAIFSMLFE